MLGAFKTRSNNATAKAATGKTASTDAREFIPQLAHVNAHTLFTKNGELMQTIRISKNRNGLDYEPHDTTGGNLRDCIRKALARHIPGDNIAIWIHTLRKRRGMTFDARYDNRFADYVNQRWRSSFGWSHQYYNEVYVTLVYEGQTSSLFDKDMLKEGSTIKKNRAIRDNYTDAAMAELDLIMQSIADELDANYQVHRLQVVERMADATEGLPAAPVFYSEPMEFLSYLLNLRAIPMPLPDADISAALQATSLLFGFNALETKSEDGAKRFGALLSLKQYREVPSQTVDMLLQAPMELIVSQAFYFVPDTVALKEYREQKELFDMSGDEYSIRASGLADMLMANRKLPTDFGMQQTSITVLVDELKALDEDVGRLQKAFSGIGLVCIREDIRLEEMFWSTLPGNFNFIRRKSTIPTSLIGGFAKLNRFASGNNEHTFWAQPVALLPTLVNSPYFFNFHAQDNGHTLWLDFNSFADRITHQSLSFLLTQAHKLRPRVFYFDHLQSAALWFDKLGAAYYALSASAPPALSLNPFSLECTPRNVAFLAAWCGDLIGASPAEREQVKAAVEQYCQAQTARSLPGFVASAGASPWAARFSPWLEHGAYGGLFAGASDDFSVENDWLGIDLTAALATPQNAVAAFAYLLHRVILTLDGRPTIIVLQHALPILSQPFFASRLSSLLEMLKENNAMMICCVRYSPAIAGNPVLEGLLESCASKIISPDEVDLEYAKILPALLTPGDQDMLQQMRRGHGDILLKQGAETVALHLNLETMPDVAAIFNNDIKTLMSAGGPFSSIPKGAL